MAAAAARTPRRQGSVALEDLLRREASAERDAAATGERPVVAAEQAGRVRKGEDFALLKPTCERYPGAFFSAFAVLMGCFVLLWSQMFDGHNGGTAAVYAKENLLTNVLGCVPVDLSRGESVESRSGGVWRADAELWNGRFAMLGLVALAVTEFIIGTPTETTILEFGLEVEKLTDMEHAAAVKHRVELLDGRVMARSGIGTRPDLDGFLRGRRRRGMGSGFLGLRQRGASGGLAAAWASAAKGEAVD